MGTTSAYPTIVAADTASGDYFLIWDVSAAAPRVKRITRDELVTLAQAGIVEVPAGGTTGQVLAKASNTDGDLTWATASSGGGSAFEGAMLKRTTAQTSANGAMIAFTDVDMASSSSWYSSASPYYLKTAEACIVEVSYQLSLTGLTDGAALDAEITFSGTISHGTVPDTRSIVSGAVAKVTGSSIMSVSAGGFFFIRCIVSTGDVAIGAGSRWTIRKIGPTL